MGTNYYAEVNKCKTCGHAAQRYHIGKASMGWQFSFRGYIDHEEIKIATLENWREFLLRSDVKIYDEYGSEISCEEMFKIFTRKGQNHYDWIKINQPYYLDNKTEWKDPEGYSFSSKDFC